MQAERTGWAAWGDAEWQELERLCRRDGVQISSQEIRDSARSYMERGTDGGGNKHGLAGIVIALNCDEVMRGVA